MTNVKKYLLFTFITTWTITMIGIHDFKTGSLAGMASFSQAVSFCMLVPTFGALFAKADIRNMGWRPDFERNFKLMIFAWLLPTFFEMAGAVFYYIVFPDDFETSGAFLRDIDCSAYEEIKKNGGSYGSYVAKEIFYSMTSFYIIRNIFFGLGEEIGWRGFLYPELKKKLGKTKGVLLGGVIHGVWHFPLIIFIGYEYGNDYFGAPVLGPFTFCLFTVTTGIISNFLYERSKSIWLPAIIHGATNSTFNPCVLRGQEHLERSIFGPMDTGLIAMIPMVLFAAGILYFEITRGSMDDTEL